MFLSRNFDFDAVIIDQRDDVLATRLILPLMACFDKPVKLVVISALKEAEAYHKVPGIAKIVPVPVRDGQLLRALGLEAASGKKSASAAQLHQPAPMVERQTQSRRAVSARKKLLSKTPPWRAIAASVVTVAVLSMALIQWLPGSQKNMMAQSIPPPPAPAKTITAAESKGLADRIARAKVEKQSAEAVYQTAKSQVDGINANVRELLRAAQSKVVDQQRKASIITRERETLTSEVARRRSAVELQSRHASGLIDRESMELVIMRILSTDQRLKELDAETNTAAHDSKAALGELRILQALTANLEGRTAKIPKPVPVTLLPLVRDVAKTISKLDVSRKQLEAAEQALQLFLDKRQQLKKQQAFAPSAARQSTGMDLL